MVLELISSLAGPESFLRAAPRDSYTVFCLGNSSSQLPKIQNPKGAMPTRFGSAGAATGNSSNVLLDATMLGYYTPSSAMFCIQGNLEVPIAYSLVVTNHNGRF